LSTDNDTFIVLETRDRAEDGSGGPVDSLRRKGLRSRLRIYMLKSLIVAPMARFM
jgi:hypothetical protein